jgi:outer membrane murein-binding lipoprotein Lpp
MRILLIAFCLAFLLLAGCVSQAEYDTLQEEADTLREANQDLSQDNLELREQLDDLHQGFETLKQNYALLEERYDNVTAPREFQDVSELRAWLAEDETSKLEFKEGTQDCDDFARILMYSAFEDGYLIGIVANEGHIMNLAFIGPEAYLIEPQTDKYEFAGYTWE